jgi:hypothetical protein
MKYIVKNKLILNENQKPVNGFLSSQIDRPSPCIMRMEDVGRGAPLLDMLKKFIEITMGCNYPSPTFACW